MSDDGIRVVACIVAVLIFLMLGIAAAPDKKICREPDCDNECASGSDYCYIHKPYKSNVAVNRGTLSSVAVSPYTSRDSESVNSKCLVSDCNNESYRESRYCALHKCRQSGCNDRGGYGGGGYCYKHSPHSK